MDAAASRRFQEVTMYIILKGRGESIGGRQILILGTDRVTRA
jgi:hypothetical protein